MLIPPDPGSFLYIAIEIFFLIFGILPWWYIQWRKKMDGRYWWCYVCLCVLFIVYYLLKLAFVGVINNCVELLLGISGILACKKHIIADKPLAVADAIIHYIRSESGIFMEFRDEWTGEESKTFKEEREELAKIIEKSLAQKE